MLIVAKIIISMENIRCVFSDAPEEIAVKIGNYFSPEEKGFSGNDADYYNTDNHYINKVIETRKEFPLSSRLFTCSFCGN